MTRPRGPVGRAGAERRAGGDSRPGRAAPARDSHALEVMKRHATPRRTRSAPRLLQLPLETARLVLRDFVPDDLAAMGDYAADARVLEHVLHEARDAGELARHLERVLAGQRARPRRTWELAVVVRRTARVVGSCDLTLIGADEADLGYLLARRHWGRGYGTEVACALVDAAFLQLGVRRVHALVDVRNDRSRRVLEKAGLRWEGLLRRHAHAKDRWWDCHVYALARRDWAAARGAAATRALGAGSGA